MKVIEETVVSEIKKKWYIAKDGSKFESDYLCREYENDCDRKELERRDDIIFYNEIDGYAPFDGKDHYEDSCYIWMKPLTTEAVEKIKEAYPYEFLLENQYLINKIICIEGGIDDWWWYLFDDSVKYANSLIGKINEHDEREKYHLSGGREEKNEG